LEVTLTLILQLDAPAAAFTPVPPTEKTLVPAVAVIVGAPPQPLTTPGVPAMTTPGGKLSVNVRPVRAGPVAGLVMVKVRTEVPPRPMMAGANSLVS
jgi:hypothetical protein